MLDGNVLLQGVEMDKPQKVGPPLLRRAIPIVSSVVPLDSCVRADSAKEDSMHV